MVLRLQATPGSGVPELTLTQLTGTDEAHLVRLDDGHRLHPEAARAWRALQADARAAGFDLAIASSFRSFARQRAIWDGKASGARPVHDDAGRSLDLGGLADADKAAAILRFSALPGTSRHHWGTDLDVYDASAVPADYAVQLSPAEVGPGGPFDPLHCWLDARMAAGESRGFYRPYARDRGGVAVERWHLSFAPLSRACDGRVDAATLRQCWDAHAPDLALRGVIEAELAAILERYVRVPAGWCPGPATGG